ncbi:Prefoldin alpha-like [Arabidopsis thaliana x Arabidopsis arenosa]|uniref:Prefoldin alpha-like n=1 Tax=Arabidopsis thaliana x Arabidopsis arenosa TaxID=1240361 RepID=A0A8T1XK55_9BRAS|nr:Prefoldin alpha-like [Arabidopsis thaliana x Arabidopsis arenosa]
MASSSSRGEMKKMGIDKLKALKEQADLEVNPLQNSLNNIRTATARLDAAAAALNDLSSTSRSLDEADEVLVDIGTGYFVEKTMDDGNDYCQRKIHLLKSNFDQLFEVI